MAVHYYLSKKIDRNGEAPIQVTISLKGVRLQTSVGHSIPASKWLAETERVRNGCTNSKGTSYSKIIAFPDINAYHDWLRRTADFPHLDLKVSDLLEKHATPEARTAHIDLADWLLEYLTDKS